jgi:hypothetical protein
MTFSSKSGLNESQPVVSPIIQEFDAKKAREKMELNKLRLLTLGDLFAMRSLIIQSNPEGTTIKRLMKLLLNYLSTLPSDYVKSGIGKVEVEEFTSAIFVCL